MNLYWGDIHNHCGISYGYGSLENALQAARQQLDFCAVTGHAMWPDMPTGEPGFEQVIESHLHGFKKLADQWDSVRTLISQANNPGHFTTFQGYEIHSSIHGDYHLLSTDDSLPIIEATSPIDLVEKLSPRPVIAIPHHVGYTPGYRGCNWQTFSPSISPVVEVYSKHGCGISDSSPFPYLHTMGPRDSRTTVFAGLNRGRQFGFTASTDHHAGYPGSHGDGRMAVLAEAKTRPAIWQAILARRTYAVTGDKIACNFSINGNMMGSIARVEGAREIELEIKACDRIDRIVLYKNLQPWRIVNRKALPTRQKPLHYKIKLEMGWGRNEQGFLWTGRLSLDHGRIVTVEPCFRGLSILAPQVNLRDSPAINQIENSILGQSADQVAWKCTSFKNPTTLHSQTAALIVEVEGDETTTVELEINNLRKRISIGKLQTGGFSAHLKPYNSEAVLVHPAIPETAYKFKRTWIDRPGRDNNDMYHVEIHQINGQAAWISPIWVQ